MGITTLKEFVYTNISSIASTYDNNQAINNSVFPYVTYELNLNEFNSENSHSGLILEVNVWDNKPDTSIIDGICDTIITVLNREILHVVGTSAIFYLVSRIPVVDEDINIRHRQLNFEVKSYM